MKRISRSTRFLDSAPLSAIKITLSMILLFVIFRYEVLLLIIFFEIIDILKLILFRTRKVQFPVDFVLVFGITAAYYYNYISAIIIFALGIMNRVETEHIKGRHMTKCIRHFILFYLARLLSSFSFFTLAVFLLLINYLLKYFMAFMQSDEGIYKKLIYHIFNFTASAALFFLISIMLSSILGAG